MIKDLLLSNLIDRVLDRIKKMIRAPYDKKEKDNQTKLYTHIFRNCKRIVNQLNLKDQKIEITEEIESNVR